MASISKKSLTTYNVMDNKNVLLGYNYWLSYFTDMTMDLFEWQGLPATLPSEEIEKRLIRNGFSIIFKHPIEGIVTCDGNLYDYDFYKRFRMFNVANPYRTFYERFIPSGKVIGKDGIVIYNTGVEKYIDFIQTDIRCDNLFYTTIRRYARMMADIESTLSAELISQRMPFMPIATTQQNYESIKNVFKKLENGDMEAAIDSDFTKDIKILKNKELVANYLSELINNRRNILSMFYSEIGMFQPDSKRERLLVDEIENGKNNEKTLIYSLLRQRLQGVKQLNEFFGLNATVDIRYVLYNEETPITELTESEVQ